MAYSGKKGLIWVVVLGKACLDVLSWPQHAGDHGVSSIEDGLGVSLPMGICSALD